MRTSLLIAWLINGLIIGYNLSMLGMIASIPESGPAGVSALLAVTAITAVAILLSWRLARGAATAESRGRRVMALLVAWAPPLVVLVPLAAMLVLGALFVVAGAPLG
jgi:hypothetical protein